MSNSIALASKYVPALDEVYKLASLTSDLDGATDLAKQGANANELIIPVMTMDGLADYSRNSGYVTGDVTLVNKTVACNYDRGRKFSVDYLDDEESANIAFGKLAGEFIRTQLVPELDAFRFAAYAAKAGNVVSSGATLSTGADVVAALREANDALDEDEVPYDERYLYITGALEGLLADMDTTKSREVLDNFSKITKVPQGRFYTAITLRDGKTSGQEAGGYTKASGAKDINFMVIHKPAVIQFQKHIAPKIIRPEVNPDGDAWIFGYRNVGIADVYYNKTNGIYLHHKAS